MDNIKSLDLDSRNVTVEQFLCADFKMMANLYGLVSSNGNNACIFCKQNLFDDNFDQYL